MRLSALLVLALSIVTPAGAEPITDRDWQLLAIDGVVLPFEVTATLRIGKDGSISGTAPCNSWGTSNRASLPALELGGIRATRRACDQLAAEDAFFKALAAMTSAESQGYRNLILTGPGGRSMEFVHDRMNSLTRCLTCPPKE